MAEGALCSTQISAPHMEVKVMSKSAIYTANTSTQDVAINGVINPGVVVRRYGPNIILAGEAIQLCGSGYYDVDASITLAPAAIGNVTVSLLKDGTPIQGASASTTVTTANTPVNLSISSLVREFCNCFESVSNLTFVLTGTAATISNISIVVQKI